MYVDGSGGGFDGLDAASKPGPKPPERLPDFPVTGSRLSNGNWQKVTVTSSSVNTVSVGGLPNATGGGSGKSKAIDAYEEQRKKCADAIARYEAAYKTAVSSIDRTGALQDAARLAEQAISKGNTKFVVGIAGDVASLVPFETIQPFINVANTTNDILTIDESDPVGTGLTIGGAAIDILGIEYRINPAVSAGVAAVSFARDYAIYFGKAHELSAAANRLGGQVRASQEAETQARNVADTARRDMEQQCK